MNIKRKCRSFWPKRTPNHCDFSSGQNNFETESQTMTVQTRDAKRATTENKKLQTYLLCEVFELMCELRPSMVDVRSPLSLLLHRRRSGAATLTHTSLANGARKQNIRNTPPSQNTWGSPWSTKELEKGSCVAATNRMYFPPHIIKHSHKSNSMLKQSIS